MVYGLIFDLDGVITDTAEYHFRAWQRLAAEIGVPFTREDNEALRGVSRRQSLALLLKGARYPEADMQAMMARKNDYYVGSLEAITPDDLLPGAAALVTQAKAKGYRIGLGSASRNARAVLERLQLLDAFDVIGDGYSVVNPKPAPDLFVWVAGGLGLNPRHCLVFEDAEAGIQAALAGGFSTVGIGPQSRVAQAHRVIARLADITLDEAEALLHSATADGFR